MVVDLYFVRHYSESLQVDSLELVAQMQPPLNQLVHATLSPHDTFVFVFFFYYEKSFLSQNLLKKDKVFFSCTNSSNSKTNSRKKS